MELGEESDTKQSTLSALQSDQAQVDSPELAQDTPEETVPKRRHRRPVEGPEAVAEDLRIVALGIAGDMDDSVIEAAGLDATRSVDDALRLAAYRALLKRVNAGLLHGQTPSVQQQA